MAVRIGDALHRRWTVAIPGWRPDQALRSDRDGQGHGDDSTSTTASQPHRGSRARSLPTGFTSPEVAELELRQLPSQDQYGPMTHDETLPEVDGAGLEPVPTPLPNVEAQQTPTGNPTGNPRWHCLTGLQRTAKNSIPRSMNLRFCFTADGKSLIIWRGERVKYLVRMHLPVGDGDILRGQKLYLRRGSEPSEVQIAKVAGGGDRVAAVVFHGSEFRLLLFDRGGSRVSQVDYGSTEPLSLSVSPNGDHVALGTRGRMDIYSAKEDTLRATAQCEELPESGIPGQPGLQATSFSPDSAVLAIATQINGGHSQNPDLYTNVLDVTPDAVAGVDAQGPYPLHIVSVLLFDDINIPTS